MHLPFDKSRWKALVTAVLVTSLSAGGRLVSGLKKWLFRFLLRIQMRPD